ncbi:DUF2520 domain-containing protein [Aquabacterium sp. A7-Y]|uniref:Rossmann-like and DUF2520 domain-containing protein n=1 Tax=Aquabacterium sp. A7-Y TaxID=1349605 RepID=UPI00223CADAC|nr:DUF2520 domain-containing protein [Aquabacterium sp. A7-Y]MCW7540830.1 DUF2520 domain-containing protein [Aquabacterium sp. A7-Y]
MQLPTLCFIGAGRLARTLALSLSARGSTVAAVASRNPNSARELAAALPACAALPPEDAVQRAELVFLTVPDDRIAAVCAALPWRSGQMVVHCSGATEVGELAPAARQGAATGGFHPLQIFSDPELALELLPGSSVAIEADGTLSAALHEMAQRLEMHPITLPPGARTRYHAGASFAASFLLSMLAEAASVWASFGVDPQQALRALLPIARGTLASAGTRGLAGALAGPVSRGDLGVLQRHFAAMDTLGEEHGRFYRELTRRQLALAREAGRLDDPTLQALEGLCA